MPTKTPETAPPQVKSFLEKTLMRAKDRSTSPAPRSPQRALSANPRDYRPMLLIPGMDTRGTHTDAETIGRSRPPAYDPGRFQEQGTLGRRR